MCIKKFAYFFCVILMLKKRIEMTWTWTIVHDTANMSIAEYVW